MKLYQTYLSPFPTRVRLLSRISDIYVVMVMLPLFQIVARPPARWNQDWIRRQLRETREARATSRSTSVRTAARWDRR